MTLLSRINLYKSLNLLTKMSLNLNLTVLQTYFNIFRDLLMKSCRFAVLSKSFPILKRNSALSNTVELQWLEH